MFAEDLHRARILLDAKKKADLEEYCRTGIAEASSPTSRPRDGEEHRVSVSYSP